MTAPADAASLLQGYWQGAHLADPPAYLDRVRELSPVLYDPGVGYALLTGHAEVSAALKSPHVRTGKYDGSPEFRATASYALMSPMMLFHDGASHTRLRSLAQRAFTPRVLEESREFITGLTDDLLGRAAANGGEVDAVAALAVPLPVTVIVGMLGLSGTDADRFKLWAGSVADLLGGLDVPPERWAQVEADAAAMRSYFRTLADDLRAHPQPGLLSALAAAEAAPEEGGGRLSGEELLANAVLLLVAGHETTSNLISGSVHALHEWPEERAWLAEDTSSRVGNAVEELLRFLAPVQATSRFTTAPLTLGAVEVPAGLFLGLSLAGAGRDPRVYKGPHTLDLARENARTHLAFAAGAHYCLGASLARMEAAIFLTRLLARFPGYEVPGQPLAYLPNVTLRGLRELRVRL